MNELSTTSAQLPDTFEDLSKFILYNEARLRSVREGIHSIKRLSLAKEVYEQKLAEAQELGQITVEAGQRMGELLLQIQTAQGKRTDLTSSEDRTKSQRLEETGLTRQRGNEYEQMAQNPEAVQAAIQKAIENGDVVSRSQVMKEIRALKEELAKARQQRPEVRRVEVYPEDYNEKSAKARAYDAETSRLNKKLEESYRERNELNEKIRELEEQTVREQTNNDFIAGAIYFIAQCGSFIRDVGGYVWIADKLADLPERDRTGYIKAAMAVRDWATVLLQNIERSDYGKREIERVGLESQ